MSGGVRSTSAVAATAAPAGWANTATKAFNLAGASDLGALASNQTLTVRVGLALQNAAQLKNLVASGEQIDPASFNGTYAPSQAQVSAVTSYLSSHGFSNVTVEPNNLLISATGTAAQVATAFDTTLHSFSQNGLKVYANTTPAYVPTSLSGIVVAVLGLNNAQTMKPKPKLQPTACQVFGVSSPDQACLRFYDPATFQIAYDATKVPTGKNTAVAIMAEGDVTQSISDLRLNEKNFNLPQVPVNVVKVGLPSTDTAGDGEWTLDMTYSSGMAGTLKAIYLYDTTSLTDSDIALEYNKWVTQHLTKIGNSSFGGCEYGPYLDGSMLVDDEILLQGAAQGQTMFVSTGDSGGFCSVGVPNGAPAGAPLVEYPAASPYVVAVGGTDLFSNSDGTYKGENSWEAGGGGLSQFEYSPYWEASEQPVSGQGESFRGLPDIAMDAAIETGAELWGGSAANGSCTPCVTGGTSLASPLAAGAYARMQTAHDNRLGFAPPLLYKNYVENTAGSALPGPPPTRPWGGFHDILAGSNVTYTALPGYDYTTGLGSFDIGVMNAQIGK
jgi:subtilase family serine protease